MFREGSVTLKHIKTWTEPEDRAKARFHKTHPVPYALCPKVEAELQHLVDQGILSKVDRSECAMQMVSVGKKKTDKVHICIFQGDSEFHTTCRPNPFSKMDDNFESWKHMVSISQKLTLQRPTYKLKMDKSS